MTGLIETAAPFVIGLVLAWIVARAWRNPWSWQTGAIVWVVTLGAGMLLLAAAPMVSVVVAVQIVRRAGNYAISRPAREMLFTAVDRETRFKAKPGSDIVVYRGGDMLNAWGFTALTQGLGLGLAATAGVGAGIAVLWAGNGIALGRSFNKRAAASQPPTQSH